MHVFHVPAQVSALSEGLLAELALEGPLPSVLSEVIPKITRLLEDGATAFVATLEV